MRHYGNPPPENYGCHCSSCAQRWKERNAFTVEASAWLAINRPDIKDPVKLVAQVCVGLDPAPVLFRDLKPNDIMWVEDTSRLMDQPSLTQ